MSDVEKITFANHSRRRRLEIADTLERRAVASARAAAKEKRMKSWLRFAAYASYMFLGALMVLATQMVLSGNVGPASVLITVTLAAIMIAFWLSEKVEQR